LGSNFWNRKTTPYITIVDRNLTLSPKNAKLSHSDHKQSYYLILLVTEGRMQNFKTLAQPLLGEFGWGFLLLFLLSSLPHESKVNSQVWPGVGVWQNAVNSVHLVPWQRRQTLYCIIGPSVLRAPAEQTKVATVFGN
jgi:hypothetical protein